jgi:hypothetical protein
VRRPAVEVDEDDGLRASRRPRFRRRRRAGEH